MGIEHGGYIDNPGTEKNKVFSVISTCIDLGVYVIVDWHDHNAHNNQGEAIDFFAEVARLYGGSPNLIYEIYNEPFAVSWFNTIKPYAETVIDTIRKIDPDNLIIVGTPNWSQDVDSAAVNPLQYSNIAYALHFYAATHKQYLRDKASIALEKGLALFVSEWGTCESSGSGKLDTLETEIWFDFMARNNISWCNWSVADKDETASALKPGADEFGNWDPDDLTSSGDLVRKKIIGLTVDNTGSSVILPSSHIQQNNQR
jgi:endoglucanase